MKERIKIREYQGLPDTCVEYSIDDQILHCSLTEWIIYEIQLKLVKAGADEDLVEELRCASWSNGYSDAEMDHAESEGL